MTFVIVVNILLDLIGHVAVLMVHQHRQGVHLRASQRITTAAKRVVIRWYLCRLKPHTTDDIVRQSTTTVKRFHNI